MIAVMSWYFTLLSTGLFLIGAEIFVPGGILGICGAAALIAAVIIGFTVFPPVLGWLSLLLILILTALAVFLWMKFFPKSPIGRALALNQNSAITGKTDSEWKTGMRGTALSDLRPAGKALLDGRRADVIANSTWIEQNASIEISKVEGNRIYVRQI
ncbi:MAG: NfeD family protein [Kiritimatiellales bacterium]